MNKSDTDSNQWQLSWSVKPFVVAVAIVTGGCQTPAERIDTRAAELGLVRQILRGTHYRHLSYSSPTGDAGVLHIYIEGDGSPWSQRHRISDDPTPKRSITLELMSLDNAQTLYLGRPCYHGQTNDRWCIPWMWTHGRYSSTVVDSMEAALRSFIQPTPGLRMRFFGFSGGGALVVLLAARFVETETVVTIAGNLDIGAWARHHGYSELAGSMNPASMPPLARQVHQLHLVGLRDEVVPPALIERYMERQPHSKVIRYPQFDHHCCWREIWPSILTQIQ